MKLHSTYQPLVPLLDVSLVFVWGKWGGKAVRLFGAHVGPFFFFFLKLGLIGLAEIVLCLEAQMLEDGWILGWLLCGILFSHFWVRKLVGDPLSGPLGGASFAVSEASGSARGRLRALDQGI